jgi:pimeloyl-ACP methyl ester carboxylesterase
VDRWVKAGDGTRLLVRQSGSGRSLVLVHPSSGGLDSFAPIAPLFDGLELWAYARRGYAPSESPVRQKTFADDVADLQAVIAATGGPVDLLGASHGATVALHAAHIDSSQIRSLVLFEPPLFAAGPALAPVLERYRAHVEQGSLAEAAWLFAADVARVPGPLLDALTAAGDDAAADPAEAVGCLHDLEAMAHDDTEIDRWADVDVPVLLLQGEKTWAPVPATMDALAAVLPSVTRVVLAGQAHFATHTAPALFAQAVTKFLAAT